MRYILPFLYFICSSFFVLSQEKVTFPSNDGLLITADLYEKQKDAPYLLLFHQAESSRGEYKETAPKLLKYGYNCLAVDLRSGKEMNYIHNETAKRAKSKDLPTDYFEAEKDILAAIDYAFKKNKKQVVLLGSSYSASICLMLAHNPKVKAVIAFSPGEYFGKNISVKNTISNIEKQVFAGSSKKEFPYVTDLMQNIKPNYKIVFQPEKGEGVHGSRSLWEICDAAKEYWFALTIFFKKISSTN